MSFPPASVSERHVGYTTGTFDLPLRKHFELLKHMKARCDYLIVGLTSDELAEKQKRKAFMRFEQRKSILEHCLYVDEVVVHRGEPKYQAWQRMRFDTLFIGEDYWGKEEYAEFEKQAPSVQVLYLSTPCDPPVHTTHLIRDMKWTCLEALKPFRSGINGMLLRFQDRDVDYVIKPVHLSIREFPSLQGPAPNVFELPFPPPRNWKIPARIHQHAGIAELASYPNIAGYNNAREVKVHQHILGTRFVWNPVWKIQDVSIAPLDPVFGSQKPEEAKGLSAFRSGFSHIEHERRVTPHQYWLFQHYAGPTLREWVQQYQHTWTTGDARALSTSWQSFLRALEYVESILQDLQKVRLVHGDIHPGNVCVLGEKTSLIDFGWCQHYSFGMDHTENQAYQHALTKEFDRQHWYLSMDAEWSHYVWWPHLTHHTAMLHLPITTSFFF